MFGVPGNIRYPDIMRDYVTRIPRRESPEEWPEAYYARASHRRIDDARAMGLVLGLIVVAEPLAIGPLSFATVALAERLLGLLTAR